MYLLCALSAAASKEMKRLLLAARNCSRSEISLIICRLNFSSTFWGLGDLDVSSEVSDGICKDY